MKHYPALIRKEPDSDFGVEFPDFDGCVTAGITVQEAIDLAEEALEFHVSGMRDDGQDIPEPTPIEVVTASSRAVGAMGVMVPLREGGPIVRLELDKRLAQEIEASANSTGTTVEGFIVQATRDAIHRKTG